MYGGFHAKDIIYTTYIRYVCKVLAIPTSIKYCSKSMNTVAISTRIHLKHTPTIRATHHHTHIPQSTHLHVRSQAGEGLSACPSHPHQKCVPARQLDDAGNSCHMLQSKL